jgi:anti-anti-sigma factor
MVKGRVFLSGEMNIYAAPLLKNELLAALRANLGDAAIDLAQVTEMDTAGLQMIMLARRLSLACGSELRLLNPSEPAREVLELCGLQKLIVDERRHERRRVRNSPSRSRKQ